MPTDLARFKHLFSISFWFDLIWFLKFKFHVFNYSTRLSICLFQTCWHLEGPRAPTDLACFRQWTGRGFCCSAIARLIGLPLQLDCMVWESPGFLVFHQTSPKKSHKAFQYWKTKGKTVLPTRRGSPSSAWGILGSPGTLPSQQQSSSSLPEHKVQWIRLS